MRLDRRQMLIARDLADAHQAEAERPTVHAAPAARAHPAVPIIPIP